MSVSYKPAGWSAAKKTPTTNEPRKKPSYFPLDWLVNMDHDNGYYNPYIIR